MAVYRNWNFEHAEGADQGRFTVFAIDLATGRSWDIYAAAELISAWPAGDRLVVWSADSLTIHSVSLDGESEALLQSSGALAPHVSPDGSKIAFPVDGSPSGEPDSIIVLDVQSGDEFLRIKADDPRIDAREADWSLEVTRWSIDGTALLVWGAGAGTLVITLDGEVRTTPTGRLSLDLRYAADAPRLVSTGARSLTVFETATEREILTLTPEEGRVIFGWDWGLPASGKAIYGTVPRGAVNERPARQAVWRIVDLDTGGTTTVSLDEQLRADWDWLWSLQDGSFESPWGQCLIRHEGLDPCIELLGAADEALYSLHGEPTTAEERRERDTFMSSTELLGFIWLD
ncbi:MAG: hypothetical protein F4Z77_10605 [Dehalococcoidia bacterium]|nr:hypothetical protein [Dehalococcoidia bacterium]MYA52503.1 hypothetical protein [Dehalococcoidia bacterium]